MSGWLRSYLLAAAAAAVVATCAFVSYRNRTFSEREIERARDAARTFAEGAPRPANLVAGGVVKPAERSERYPFLKQRRLTGGRRLGGPNARATDKLLYDAAARAEREGPFSELSGGGRAVAALRAPDGTAVAVTQAPGGAEPFPWLVFFGLLFTGALVAAAGAMVGGASRTIGLALGAGGLAVPAYLWCGALVGAIALGAAWLVALADRRGLVDRAAAALRRDRAAYAFFGPTALAMLALVAVPFAYGVALGFYNHHDGQWTFVGLQNFIDILSGDGRSLTDPLNFWFTLAVTALWTAVNVVLHVSLGVALALWLRRPWMRGRRLFKALLILPWAIPNYITALIWSGMFQSEHGAVNGLLSLFGLGGVDWFSGWATAFTANVCTNTWLGFPFMMVVALGALESIPQSMYEAAEVDGASARQRFVHVTLPHLRPAMVPAMVLGAIWTFNMFNVIYLVSEGQPAGGTDILVTEAYRWAFERGERYGLASAYAVLIFLCLLLWTVFGTRALRKEEA